MLETRTENKLEKKSAGLEERANKFSINRDFKNAVDRLNNRWDTDEGKISLLEIRVEDLNQMEEREE